MTFNGVPIEGSRTFAIGSFNEGPSWEIRYDVEIELEDLPQNCRCKHCGDIYFRTSSNLLGGNQRAKTFYVCPRVVVAHNEGGFNLTMVCLDCIMEGAMLDSPVRSDSCA